MISNEAVKEVLDEVTKSIVLMGDALLCAGWMCIGDPARHLTRNESVRRARCQVQLFLTWILFDRTVWLKGCAVKMRVCDTQRRERTQQ